MRAGILLGAWLAAPAVLLADVKPGTPFADHAVLQRDKPVTVWGSADPGEAVKVVFKDQVQETKADTDGKWKVRLAPLSASAEPAELVVSGKNTVTVKDVLVGEVWFCSGQSNMAFTVKQTSEAQTDIAAANFPLIREFKVDREVADAPAETAVGQWQPASPATVGDFTAVGYFFGLKIFQELKVPVGLITAAWGGTYVESWLTPSSLEHDPAGQVAKARWQKILAAYPKNLEAYKAARKNKAEEPVANGEAEGEERVARRPAGPGDKDTAGGLFNGMVNPFTRYAIRGVLWYQGEANVPRSKAYAPLFQSLITRWREAFGEPALPFYWVQLPNFMNTGVDLTERAILRDAQAAALALPATGQAVTIDIGEERDNHPKNKKEVGRRLALIAGAQVYEWKGESSGPKFIEAKREGDSLKLSFSHAEGGLVAKMQPLGDFQVAGVDQKFFPAGAEITGETVVVRSAEVAEPAFVRYAWRNAPVASLFNAAGLPAAPFRTDR